MKKILIGLTLIAGLVALDDQMFDLAEVWCKTYTIGTLSGYPTRVCSITFDDKGLIARVSE